MIEVGRLCTKIAGREAGKICVVVDEIDKNYCLIDGQVRRKKCNITHLDPLDKKIEIEKGADYKKIVSEFKKLGIEIKEKIKKEKSVSEENQGGEKGQEKIKPVRKRAETK